MRFSMHDSWCNLLIKILDLTWICWEQGNNIAPQGLLRSDGWKPLFGEAIQCIFSCRIRYQSRGMITRPAPLLDSVVVPGREHFAVRIHNPVNRRECYPSLSFRYRLLCQSGTP